MTEPTIDEMLKDLEVAKEYCHHRGFEWESWYSIRAILEQHREIGDMTKIRASEYATATEQWKRRLALEAIRAFVGRVQERFNDGEVGSLVGLLDAMTDELNAMEKGE